MAQKKQLLKIFGEGAPKNFLKIFQWILFLICLPASARLIINKKLGVLNIKQTLELIHFSKILV